MQWRPLTICILLSRLLPLRYMINAKNNVYWNVDKYKVPLLRFSFCTNSFSHQIKLNGFFYYYYILSEVYLCATSLIFNYDLT